ncbi:MAG: hypothetical protein ACKVPY_15835 [Paracoccaceae bacterium]
MSPLWFLRMKRWAANPPSAARVKFVLGIVALALAILAAERAGLLPDWAALDPRGLRP